MKEEKIKVLALLPMELPKEIELDNTLEAMQKFVGGLIECITLSDTGSEVTLVCNDEGKLLGLPLNRPLWDGADVLAGPGFLAGCDNEGNLTSLPQSAMDFYKEKFRAFIIEIYVQYWDSLADASALERFRDALYAAARKQSIRFRAIGNIDETYCKEIEVLYDEYKLYITLDLVKSLVSEYMSEFLVSDVLAQLSEAGILSDSIVKTLTLSAGHPKNVRLRSINRSFVNGHGRRDITTI